MSEAVRFTGSVPERYDRYMVSWLFDPYAADLARRLPDRPGLRVLETAAGMGAVTRHLRAALPEGATVVATDLNAIVGYARTAVPEPGSCSERLAHPRGEPGRSSSPSEALPVKRWSMSSRNDSPPTAATGRSAPSLQQLSSAQRAEAGFTFAV